MKKILVIATMLALSAGISYAQPKFEGSLREVLVKGSPWIVDWNAGNRGQFNQTFKENADGSLTARSDEVGPYETIVRFSEDGKSAIWVSPHQRVVKLTLDGGQPYGEGGGVKFHYMSGRK